MLKIHLYQWASVGKVTAERGWKPHYITKYRSIWWWSVWSADIYMKSPTLRGLNMLSSCIFCTFTVLTLLLVHACIMQVMILPCVYSTCMCMCLWPCCRLSEGQCYYWHPPGSGLDSLCAARTLKCKKNKKNKQKDMVLSIGATSN